MYNNCFHTSLLSHVLLAMSLSVFVSQQNSKSSFLILKVRTEVLLMSTTYNTFFFSFVRLLAEVLLLLKRNTFFISRLNHLCAHHPPFPGFMTNFCLLVWYKRHEVISQDTGANMLPFLGTQYDAQVIQNTFHFLFVWCCFSFVLLLIKAGILILDFIVPVTSGLHGKITD